MNELELKNELNSYYRVKQLINALERSEKEHQEFIENCKTLSIDIPEDKTNVYKSKLNEVYQEAIDAKNKVLQYIELLKDYPESRAVLYARYINNENPVEMEETLMCSRRTVARKKKKAIELLLFKINS